MATIDHDPNNTEEVAEVLDRIGTAAVGTTDDKSMIEDFAEKDSNLKWLLPLIILILLVVVGFLFCSKSGTHG